jgi:hypothetical protein
MASAFNSNIDGTSFGGTFAYHLQHPEISLERHFQAKVLETADRVLARKRIYLDTNYWVDLCEARLGRPRKAVYLDLLKTLSEIVQEGNAICPINANIFAEVLKQRDEKTRLTTAELIDELSLGIALQPEDERIGTEIHHCLQRSRLGPDVLEPLERLVWTSVSYLLGYTFPTLDVIGESEMLALQKSFTDDFWNIPFSRQITMLGEAPSDFDRSWDRIAEKINRETKKYGCNPKSFKQVQVDEFVGHLDGFVEATRQIMGKVTSQALGLSTSDYSELASEDDARMLIRIFREAFRKGTLGTQLPSVVIKSSLYAAIRWDRGRDYKGNDLHDFGHASAALFYYDYFATDRGVHHLITNQLGYDKKYGATVVSDAQDFVRELRMIGR